MTESTVETERDLPALLLDTNVWIDYYLAQRPGHGSAAELVTIACEKGADLLYAVVSTKDVFYLIAADFKRLARIEGGGELDEGAACAANEVAWGCISHMDDVATAVGCDQSDVWLARKHKGLHSDYEDDLVIAAAIRSNAGCLVTNDEALLRHAPVAALGVDDAIRWLQGF